MLPPSLDRYRFQLERAVAADLGRRRRRRLGAVAGVAAGALVVVNLLPSGGDRPGGVAPASAVERAAAALRPADGTILHLHLKGRQFDDERPDVRWEHESWTRAGSGEHRTVQTQPEGPTAETAYADGVDSLWDEQSGRVIEKAAPQQDGGTTEVPFRAEALEMLRSPRAKVTKQTRGGREVVRIAGNGRVFVVDGKSYTPIELRTRGTRGGTVLRIVAYESLPAGPETEELLSIAAQHPGAPVVKDATAYDEALGRLFPNG